MLTILICDDEIKICNLIKNLIKWEELEMRFTGFVHTGAEAYSSILDQRPDIVITDIRIPDFDGLELIRKVREQGLSTEFIIISGYKHFEYAHAALRHDIVDYLLKPINQTELNNALESIKKRKQAAQVQENEFVLLSKLDAIRAKMKERFVDELQSNEQVLSVDDINTRYELEISGNNFNAFNIKIDSVSFEDNVSPSAETTLDKIITYINKIFPNYCEEYFLKKENNGLMCIYCYQEANKSNLLNAIEDIFHTGKKYAHVFSNVEFSMGVGDFQTDFSKVNLSISTAQLAVRSRIDYGGGRMILCSKLPFEYRQELKLSEEQSVELYNAIDSHNVNACEKIISSILDFANSGRGESFNTYKLGELILGLFVEYISKNNYLEMDVKIYQKKLLEFLERQWTRLQIINMIMHELESYFTQVNTKNLSTTLRPIQEIKKYIDVNYATECTLNDIAKIVHFTPAYLGTLFKTEVGISYSKYLMNVRVEKAKQLLKKTDDSIALIADAVGYKDIKHFRKIFKKVVGVNPTEFRNIYR